MTDDPIETATDDLAEARARIEAARELLRQLGDERASHAIARLEEMAAEVSRIEAVIAGVAVAG